MNIFVFLECNWSILMAVTKTDIGTDHPRIKGSSEVRKDNSSPEICELLIDNPGGGDCGFYALSIGLIDTIQKECSLFEKSKTYDQWLIQGLQNTSLQEILEIDLEQLSRSPRHYKKDLLFKLQMSLRSIACIIYQNDPINRIITEASIGDGRANIEATSLFGKFIELVDYYLGRGDSLAKISQFNELAFSSEVQELAIEAAQSLLPKIQEKDEKEARQIQIAYVKEIFYQDIIFANKANVDSVILKGVEKIKEQGRWATHSDLKEIADQLHVNLHVIGHLDGQDKPAYPVITLRNESNIHWTTRVRVSKQLTHTIEQPIRTSLGTISPLISTRPTDLSTAPKPLKNAPSTTLQPDSPQQKEKPKQTPSLNKQEYIERLSTTSAQMPTSKENQDELNQLIRLVNRAVIDYCSYSEGIVFSFFHRHGEEGRIRARKFSIDFSNMKDLDQAKKYLIDFLENNSNGKTHPHSFRTMLFKEILNTNETKKNLNDVSKHYENLLARFHQEFITHELSFIL